MYEVICMFKDLQDFDHLYNVGDKFPRIGMSVSDERLAELSSSNNKRKKPLIRLIDGQKSIEPTNITPQYTKTDIMRLSKSELVDLATKNGISGAEELSGAKLKEMLIEHYNL